MKVNELYEIVARQIRSSASFLRKIHKIHKIYSAPSPGWHNTGKLDMKCYQKPVNKYLYIPFCSEIPMATLRGWVAAEIIRYIKRCSMQADFFDILSLLWSRLILRGYPQKFLRDVFDHAPNYASRYELLWRKKPSAATARKQMIITGYSSAKHSVALGAVMHDNKYLLPENLRQCDFVLAYRAPMKLGASLIPYRYPMKRDIATNGETPPSPRP